MLTCRFLVSGCHTDVVAVISELCLCRSLFKGLQSLNKDVGGVEVY